jgi:nucleoside phosphorylase
MRVGVVTAVGPDTRAVLRAIPGLRRIAAAAPRRWIGCAGKCDVELVQGGVGFVAAERAAAALATVPDLLVSCGFAGALRSGVEAGTVSLCDRVLWEDGAEVRQYDVPSAWTARLATALAATPVRTVAGTLMSSPRVLAGAAEKAAAGRRHDAVAVEMEAAPLAEYAREQGVALLPLRAVLDAMELSLADLPPDLASSWRARTRLLGTPGVWPTLATLRRLAAVAGTELTRSLVALVSTV